MILGVHHIAIICSGEKSIEFYKKLGYELKSRHPRPDRHDEIIMLSGYGTVLELFIDPTHPERTTNPEANGLRHLAFRVTDIERMVDDFADYRPEPIRIDPITGEKMTFMKDPDGLPIELHE